MTLSEIIGDLPRRFAEERLKGFKTEKVTSDEGHRGLRYLGSEFYFSLDESKNSLRVEFHFSKEISVDTLPTKQRVGELVKLGRKTQQQLGLSSAKLNRSRNYLSRGSIISGNSDSGGSPVTGRKIVIDYPIKEREKYDATDMSEAVWNLVMRPLGHMAQNYR